MGGLHLKVNYKYNKPTVNNSNDLKVYTLTIAIRKICRNT